MERGTTALSQFSTEGAIELQPRATLSSLQISRRVTPFGVRRLVAAFSPAGCNEVPPRPGPPAVFPRFRPLPGAKSGDKSPHSKFRRGGLTLVELLVTMTVIALLAGIILSALQASRESARARTVGPPSPSSTA